MMLQNYGGEPTPLMLKAKANNFINFKIKKMETKKMSLANIQGKLSRIEMKNIMAGSGSTCILMWGSCATYSCPIGTLCRTIQPGRICCG